MKVILEKKVQTNQRVWSIDWHPAGQALISAGTTKNVVLWKYQKQQLIKQSTIQTEHSKSIRCVKFSHLGDKIAVGSFDATISVWVFNNQNKQYQLLSTLEGHQNQVKSVSWSPNDSKIASCSRDKNIWIWDFESISYDYVCQSVLEGHTQDVKFVDWFPKQERKIVSASYDNTIRIWEGEDDDYVCKQVLQGHKSIVWNVKICGNDLFSVSEDCTVIRWRLNKNLQKYQRFQVIEKIHYLPIYALQILNQKILITGSADNSIYITQILQEKVKQQKINQVKSAKVYHESDVNCIKGNPTLKNIFASASDDQTIKVWKIQCNL